MRKGMTSYPVRWRLFHKPTLRILGFPVGSPTMWSELNLKTGKCANLAPPFFVFNQNRNGCPPPLQRLKALKQGICLELTQQLYLWRSKLSLEKTHIPFVSAGLLFRVSWATAVFVGKSPPATPKQHLVGWKALEVAGSCCAKQIYRGGPLAVINGVK